MRKKPDGGKVYLLAYDFIKFIVEKDNRAYKLSKQSERNLVTG